MTRFRAAPFPLREGSSLITPIKSLWRVRLALLKPLGGGHTKQVDRCQQGQSMSSQPLTRIVDIPDASLNETLVPSNDNLQPIALSRENFEAGSILAPRDSIKSSRGPLIIICVFCVLVVAILVLRGAA